MAIGPGASLAHYRLLEKLGEGGMGVVWKALDTKLDREVAVKFMPEAFANDRERVQRFEREAKVLASLNEPNIASIYGFEQVNGQSFLVMELVPGEDLSQRLARGALSVEEALRVCVQVARGLEAAHEHGVIHRDLKPANVRITEDGTAKVLDFGLAKAFEGGGAISGDPSLSPTVTSAGTAAGVILGTAAYMSPEQARGRTLDRRTDIWSFGCLLFESLGGRSAFGGETISDSLAAILRGEPDWSVLPGATPLRVRELLQRCLVKRPSERQRDIGDARQELERELAEPSGTVDSAVGRARPLTRTGFVALALAAILGAVLGIAAWRGFFPEPAGSGDRGPTTRLSFTAGEGRIITGKKLSPDGRMIVYASRLEVPTEDGDDGAIFLRSLDSFESRRFDAHNAGRLRFSPDGQWLAFVGTESAESSQRKLFRMPVNGSAPPLAVADWNEEEFDEYLWTTADELVVLASHPHRLVTVRIDDGAIGEPVAIDETGSEGWLELAAALPGGRHILAVLNTTERGYVYDVIVVDATTGEARLLIEDAATPRWSPSGHLLFTRHDTLLAVGFDAERLEVTSPAVSLTRGLRAGTVYDGAHYELSGDGTLLYTPGGVQGARRRLAIVGPDGSVEDWSEDVRPMTGTLEISPDGRRIAVMILSDTGLDEVWMADLETRLMRPFASDPGRDCRPMIFTPDGSGFLYACITPISGAVYLRKLDGSQEPRILYQTDDRDRFFSALAFWPDGSRLTYLCRSTAAGTIELRAYALQGELKLFTDPAEGAVLLRDVEHASPSPNGNWLAYRSSATGRSRLYVRSVLPGGELGAEIPVTSDEARVFWWRPGTGPPALRYRDPDDNYFTIDLAAGRPSQPTAVPWLETATRNIAGFHELPDGRLLVVLKGEEEKPSRELHVVLNWTDELRTKFAELSR